MSKIKWSPNLNVPCWVLAFQDSANSSVTTLRSIPRRQAVMPSAGLPECLTLGRTCQMCHKYCTAHPALSRGTLDSRVIFSYPDASGEASAPPRSRSLVAGSLVLVDGRSLSWKDACATSRDLLLIDALSSQLLSLALATTSRPCPLDYLQYLPHTLTALSRSQTRSRDSLTSPYVPGDRRYI